MLFNLENIVKLIQEPAVDIGHLPDLLNGIAAMESSRNREYALICRVD